MSIVKPLITTFITFFVLDILWLGYIGKHIYVKHLGHMLRMHHDSIATNWGAAIVVYIALVIGLMVFVITTHFNRPLIALLYGMLFGFVVYATYDFTNLAVLDKWSLTISTIDTLWGMIICGVTSAFTVWVCK